MSEPTSARQVDPRLMIKLNPALMPPRIRYQRKKFEELRKMQPLDELPEALIPHAIPSLIRTPPLLRRGYPLTRDVFAHFIEKDGRFVEGVPVLGDKYHLSGLLSTRKAVQQIVGWPVQCYHVYGIPEDEPDAVLFELANSYSVNHNAPPEVEEKLRKVLRAEGPPKWYLDSEKSQWDWRTLDPTRRISPPSLPHRPSFPPAHLAVAEKTTGFPDQLFHVSASKMSSHLSICLA
ncbi:hypothetical protein M413DRAFT_30415 [Hebeloma cylindrosporum]|uniref:Uncharacterized protein n=1 Tax=Hebeloma cylindrosporum TaxID=76867 RepID=A0A0C2YAE9_HEBCY|nr:hypothetical protein M413DRAFT_30415 [Hebeloma cylindrosporum h7]